MNFKNEININKKIILMMLLINIIVIGFSTSYALFQKTIVQNSVVKLQSGNPNIETITEYSDNIITLASGESKTINISLTNPNVDYNILYKMYYTVESGTGVVIATNMTDNPSGIMKGEKSLSITLKNNNTSDITIKLATKGALLTDEIILEDGEYEIIMDTEGPTVAVSVASSSAGVSSWYSAISIKGVATDDKSTVSTISSCITTSTTCTPNSSTSASTKTVSITGSNTTARRVCFNATDSVGNTGATICSSAYKVDQTAPSVTNVSDAGSGKITFTASDSHSGVYQYCVNQSASSTSGCSWKTATSGTQTTGEVVTEDGNYYVHVRDKAYKVGHSSVVAMTIIPNAADYIISTYGTGGLVAVNTSGTLYSGSGTIREYRYSGKTTNNYIQFNNGEMWRIIGVFKNSSGNWNLKLMRNTLLTSSELPSTYTYDGTTYRIENSTYGRAYWFDTTKTSASGNYNDWTIASLQYYLNGTDGYFGTLSSGSQVLVDKTYKYYLGNISTGYVATTLYTNERDTSNIYTGNKATWNGKIVLMYPSDAAYSRSSDYWEKSVSSTSSSTNYFYTSWISQTTDRNSEGEWLLSPGMNTGNTYGVLAWSSRITTGSTISSWYAVRPVLNLLSTATIEDNGADGSETNPYVIIE